MKTLSLHSLVSCVLASVLVGSAARAADPTVAQALGLSPLQEVDFDRPTADEIAKCTLKPISAEGRTGWEVRGPVGQLLRRFVDSNGDNRVDLWCYYKNGVEVYRDIDSNFNGKADEYRWLGTAGIRWGLDPREQGRVARWKMISAEEVTAELVAAIRSQDTERFRRLLLTSQEVAALGVSDARRRELTAKLEKAPSQFAEFSRRQKSVTTETRWVQFAASRPGVAPAGTDGSTKDLIVYDNVIAVIDTAGKHGQVHVGAIVKSGDAWRLIDAPHEFGGENTAANTSGYFFQTALSRPAEHAPMGGVPAAVQETVAKLQKIDAALPAASSTAERARLQAQRADLVEELYRTASTPKERDAWARQFADTVSAAVQAGDYPAGVKRLVDFYKSLKAAGADAALASHAKFRLMSAEYGLALTAKDAGYAKIQKEWLGKLASFVSEYPGSEDSAEAMLQLAIAEEFAGQEAKAKQWYARIAKDFPGSTRAKKAAGAIRRLESVGKVLSLRGSTIDGRALDLAALRGKVVLVHYWATWCEPCKQDFKVLKAALAKYGPIGFAIVGVNLDNERESAAAYLRGAPLAWPQLYEEGGLDSRLATELGVLTLPTMLLLDAQGKVVHRGISAAELEGELAKRFK